MPDLAIVDADLLTPFRRLRGYLVVHDGRIHAVTAGEPPRDVLDAADEVLDAAGALLAPGFVDTHVHGGGGADTMDATAEALATIARCHAGGGTTSFLPTTIGLPAAGLGHLVDVHATFVAAERARPSGARSLGLHLEGPYLNPDQAGAIPPASMRTPDDGGYRGWFETPGAVARVTLAPELPGAMGLLEALRDHGVLASLGHAQPDADQLMGAMERGAHLLTHFYSGMPGVTRRAAYRVPGLVELGYLSDHLVLELIGDGSHLPIELLQLAYRVKGPDRLILTTDAMRAAGLGPGRYHLGSADDAHDVIVEDGVAKLPDRSAFAGSVALADRLLRTMVLGAGIPLLHAVQMLTINPARLLRREHEIGALAPGARADLVLLDGDLHAIRTLVGGHTVHTADRTEAQYAGS